MILCIAVVWDVLMISMDGMILGSMAIAPHGIIVCGMIHGTTAGMTHGSTDGMIHGIMDGILPIIGDGEIHTAIGAGTDGTVLVIGVGESLVCTAGIIPRASAVTRSHATPALRLVAKGLQAGSAHAQTVHTTVVALLVTAHTTTRRHIASATHLHAALEVPLRLADVSLVAVALAAVPEVVAAVISDTVNRRSTC